MEGVALFTKVQYHLFTLELRKSLIPSFITIQDCHYSRFLKVYYSLTFFLCKSEKMNNNKKKNPRKISTGENRIDISRPLTVMITTINLYSCQFDNLCHIHRLWFSNTDVFQFTSKIMFFYCFILLSILMLQ